ncbi:MAG: glycosyltransferase family 4 protein [Prochlorotrichaceae cyanobacterium]|jgi:glycosyltransferase involved in cell wall biosynthesis
MSLVINLAFLSQRPTGLTNYALNLIPHLKTCSPHLLSADPTLWDAELSSHSISSSLSPDRGLKGHIRRLWWTQFSLPRLYQKFQGNLLFCPIPEAPLFTNCKTIVMVHDLIPLRFPHRQSPLSWYFRYGVPEVVAQATHIVCNSESTAADVMKFCGIPSQRITPIPLAYNPDRFRPLNLPRQNYFLYLGRSDPHKNLRRVIEAFSKIASIVEGELWIGGSSDRRYTPGLKRLVKERQISDRVIFLDYIPEADLPILLNQALALVFPSLWEGFGLPVLEAMACGTPVITSNQSALPEVAGDAALLVDPYSIETIAAAMKSIARNPDLWQQLSTAGLAQANRFSWEKTGEQTANVISKFL